MFGRPSISRNTDLDQGSVKELLVQADAFMENLNNFADSRRVIEKARMVSQKNPNNELDDNVAELRSVADDLARLMIRLEDSWMDARRSLEEETQVEESDLTESRDHVNEIKRHVQRSFKKNDPITYIDSRDHETHTHTFKGIKNMGGRPYAAIETGKELLMIPMYQLVLDI